MCYDIFHNVTPLGKCLYPDVYFNANGHLVLPIKERIMSLKEATEKSASAPSLRVGKNKKHGTYFFFVYNTDNYYHFIYDTIPYLLTLGKFFGQEVKNIKLLMNYPNEGKKEHYPFVLDCLKLFGLHEQIEIIDPECEYERVIVSDSYTHFYNSNTSPGKEVYQLFNILALLANDYCLDGLMGHKKLYISRRSHIHGNYTNIGTDYTSRRKMENEDELVEFLVSKGFTEIFPETMSMTEKIQEFSGATHIVGPIGGGMVNCLFCLPDTKIISINSPEFLNVNQRFLHCMKTGKLHLFNDTEHVEKTEFKTNMRVQTKDGIVGEIVGINGDRLNIKYSTNKIAGWNNEVKYLTTTVPSQDCTRLDNGLNSPWKINLERFKEFYGSVCNI